MTSKMADIETLLCPICQNEIRHDLLEKLKLNVSDLTAIEDLLHEQMLMQILELGKMASKYFKPETLTTDLQVQESLRKLSEKATELIDKQRQLANDLVKAGEEKKEKLTQEAIQKQRDLAVGFQEEIKNLQQQHGKVEEERKQEIEKMYAALYEIEKKILGRGIGQIRELSVIKDLQSACREDDFSDEKAKKHGADIVAKVKSKGNEVGTIVISVKEDEGWTSEFIEQIKKNLREEHTDWGILTSKVFPSSALNERMYVESSGIIIVKNEYVVAAYLGLRHAVIHSHQIDIRTKSQQQRETLHEQIISVLKDWVQGKRLNEVLGKIDEARNATIQTEDIMQKLQTYNERAIKNARDFQSEIRGYLQESSLILAELQEKLPISS